MAKRTRSADTATTLTLPLCAFEQARAEWRKTLKAGLGDQANPVNRSGVAIKPIYTPRTSRGETIWTIWAFPASSP